MNIFLAPADRSNIKKSIANEIDINTAQQYLSPSQSNKLRNALGESTRFNCWAMTKGRLATFRSMQIGDLVFLSITGTNLFNYLGRVIAKIESKALGRALWEFSPRGDWELIYILGDVMPISIEKKKLLSAFDYDLAYAVSGVNKIKDKRMNKMLERYGSI